MWVPRVLLKMAFTAFWILSILSSLTIGQSLPQSLLNLQRQKINDYKVQLQHTLEGTRIRRKRQAGLLTTLPDPGGFTAERFRIGSSAPEDLPYLSQYNLTTWTSFKHLGRDLVFIGTSQGDLVLLDVTEKQQYATVVAQTTGEIIAQKAKAFSYYDEEWFIVLQSQMMQSKIQLYQRIGRGLERRMSIVLPGDSDFDIAEVHGIHYLAVAVYQTQTAEGHTYQGHVTLYHWVQTQFDIIASRETYGARSVSCWVMDGILYIAVAQSINDEGNIFLGSPIFLFNSKDSKSLVLQSRLLTSGPRKVMHFSVSGSHYLVFVGLHDAEIHWWTNDQFLAWQRIDGTANASDVSVLALTNREIVLVIVLSDEVLFLTLDSTGHYVISFTMRYSGFSIDSLQFMFDGADYYALALFAASYRTHPHPIWKLGLDTYDLRDLTAVDPLIQCLRSLKDRISERKNELDALQGDLNRIWVSNKEQIILANVIIQGSASTESKAIIDEVVIQSNVTTSVRPDDIDSGLLDLAATSSSLAGQQLPSILLKSRKQEIFGTKHFSSLLSLPTLNMQSSDLDVTINGVEVSRLVNQTLKKTGVQVVNGELHIKQMFADHVNVKAVNNIDPNDMVLLNGAQNVTGLLEFFNAHGNDIRTELVNTISVSNLVTKSGDQTITELKNMKFLNSHSVAVNEQTNGEYLREMVKKIVTLDNYQEPSGRYEFNSVVKVSDLFVINPLNGNIDLSKMDLEAAKKDFNQTLKGHKIFSSPVSATNVQVSGLVNGIDLQKNLATLSSEQTFTGSLFINSNVMFHHLFTGTINNRNLEQEAVLRTSNEAPISGLKSLQKSVVVSSIEMVDSATINGIDVSTEAKTIVKHEGGVVNSEKSIFQDIVVLGNLTADTINDHLVSDLPESVWLRSGVQVIDIPVSISVPVFLDTDISVGKINDIDFDSGFVHVNGDKVMQSEKNFANVKVQSIDIAEGKLLSGVNLSSFREEKLSLDQLSLGDTVYGEKTFSNLKVDGSINTNVINSFNFPHDFLLLDGGQTVEGVKVFTSLIVVNDIIAKNIDVENFNRLNLSSIFSSAVLKESVPGKALINKKFFHLKANALSLPSTGKVDGVLMSEMFLKTVTLDGAQFVPGIKTFIQSLHFQEPVIILTLNNVDIDQYVNKVVLLSDRNVAGTKMFKGPVSVASMNAKKLVNGIDIKTLGQNVFSKTKENHINAIMFFGNDVDIDVLEIHTPALLDDVPMDSITTVNKDEFIFHPMWFLSDVQVKGNVFVSGLSNGCDLTTISSKALQTQSEMVQMVSTGSSFERLDVWGNVNFKQPLNKISMEKLKENVVGDGKYHLLSGDFHIYPGMLATRISVLGLLNGVNLSFVLTDAMLNSVPQTVRGYKVFEQDLEVEVLTGKGDVFVQELLNNINIQSMLDNTVWKTGFQVIGGDKVFSNLKVKNSSIYGFLNGLRFPEDVVMSAVSEHIPASVFIKKNVHIKLDLYVAGKIRDIQLNELVENLISLSGDEDVFSTLIFAHDVTVGGELSVDGMINNVVLDMAISTQGNAVIEGLKKLSDVIVVSNLYAPLINKHDIWQLSHAVVKYNKNETLSHSQVFKQPVYMQESLSASYINGLYLPNVIDSFLEKSQSVNGTFEFLKSLGLFHDAELNRQMEYLPYKVSNFAYFVLHQEINIGKGTRMLTGFQHKLREASWHSSVMWVMESHCAYGDMCCDLEYSYWLKINQNALASVQSGPELGKFFPLPDPLVNNQYLVVWTNTSNSRLAWCHQVGSEETVIGWLDGTGLFKVSFTVRNSPSLIDVRAFRDGFLYIVATFNYDGRNEEYSPTIVYRGNVQDSWSEYQILPIYGALSMDLTSYNYKKLRQEVLLVLGAGMGTYPDSYSSVYKWNETKRMFDLLQNIPSQYVRSVLWIYKGHDLLLAVANINHYEDGGLQCSKVLEGGRVDIYLYQNKLKLIQSLKLSGVVSMVSFEIEGETYLAAASKQLQSITVFHWQGYSSFVPIQVIESRGVTHLNYFWSSEDLYLSVTSSSSSSKLLLAFVRGRRFKNFSYPGEKSHELGDEPSDSTPVSSC